MSGQAKFREEVARGDRAALILDDPLMVEAFAAIETEYVRAWKATPVRDAEARERIWQHLQALEKVRGHLRSVIETGALARAQLREIEGRRGPWPL